MLRLMLGLGYKGLDVGRVKGRRKDLRRRWRRVMVMHRLCI